MPVRDVNVPGLLLFLPHLILGKRFFLPSKRGLFLVVSHAPTVCIILTCLPGNNEARDTLSVTPHHSEPEAILILVSLPAWCSSTKTYYINNSLQIEQMQSGRLVVIRGFNLLNALQMMPVLICQRITHSMMRRNRSLSALVNQIAAWSDATRWTSLQFYYLLTKAQTRFQPVYV